VEAWLDGEAENLIVVNYSFVLTCLVMGTLIISLNDIGNCHLSIAPPSISLLQLKDDSRRSLEFLNRSDDLNSLLLH